MARRPNLFDYATSELSQDAFLCWLLKWADHEYATVDSALHQTATGFLQSIGRKCRIDVFENAPALQVEIRKQYSGIDILALLSTGKLKYGLVIEDKIDSFMHDGQLDRYREVVERKFSDHQKLFVYFKTGEVSQADEVEKNGYAVFTRTDFLETLEQYAGETKDSIFGDYYKRLRQMDNDYQEFRNSPICTWSNSRRAWEGFFSALQRKIPNSVWQFVNNPGGGEYIFDVGSRKAGDLWVGLTITKKWGSSGDGNGRSFLAFKVGPVPKEMGRAQVRDGLHKSLMMQAERGGWGEVVNKPARFGNGYWMVFGEITDQDVWLAKDADGKLNMAGTIQKLEKVEKLLDLCVDGK